MVSSVRIRDNQLNIFPDKSGNGRADAIEVQGELLTPIKPRSYISVKMSAHLFFFRPFLLYHGYHYRKFLL